MRQFSRRTLLRSSAVLRSSAIMAAPLFPARGEPGLNRNLLTKAWPMERVAKVLIPRESFRPFPAAGERGAWEALPADARAALVQSAEKQLQTPWDSLPATLALEFKRNGNRSRYEAVRDRRRKRLQDLAIAECIEGKGRFIDEIANGAWLTCCPGAAPRPGFGCSRSPIPLRASNPMLADRAGYRDLSCARNPPPPTTGNGALCSISANIPANLSV